MYGTFGILSYIPQVWDGLTGTQLQSLTTHEADVLCLCVSEGQTEIFASGCDGKVKDGMCTYRSMSLGALDELEGRLVCLGH